MAGKTTAKTTELRPQPHGGALRNGGTNKGGTGRPPSVLREQLRGSFGDRIKVLEDVADGVLPDTSPADQLRAIDILAKYGLGTTKEISVEEVRERLQKTLNVLREQLSPEQFEQLLPKMEAAWRG